MANVKIKTSPDAGYLAEALVYASTGGDWRPATLTNHVWQKQMTPGVYLFEHTLDGPNGTQCGIVVSLDGVENQKFDKADHETANNKPDVFPFAVTVP